jgi:hypothetical protein
VESRFRVRASAILRQLMRRTVLASGVLFLSFACGGGQSSTTPSTLSILTAPVWRAPANCTMLTTRPILWSWDPVPGAASYRFLDDVMGSCSSEKWCSEVYTPILVPVPTPRDHQINFAEMILPLPALCGPLFAGECSATSLSWGPPGDQPMRAQVWAVDSAGHEGPHSAWRTVSYQSYEKIWPGRSGC